MAKLPETIDEMFPPQWLQAGHLDGKPTNVEIGAVNLEMIHQQDHTQKLKPVIDFSKIGRSKLQGIRWIANETQCRRIAELAGSQRFADWQGLKLTLAPGIAPNRKPTIVVQKYTPPAQPVVAQEGAA